MSDFDAMNGRRSEPPIGIELGIRRALGARQIHVMRVAVARPLALLTIGTALGLLAGILANRFLGQLVYQANSGDPLVVAASLVTMVLIGLAGSAIPARRALAADPSQLMRAD